MRKSIALFSLLLAVAFAAYGCMATPVPVAATVAPTQAATPSPAATVAPTAEPTAAPTAAPTDEAPKPMAIACTIPDGFTNDEDSSTDAMSVYRSDIATIQLGWVATTAETATPDSFLASIKASLPNEANASGFKLESSTATIFGSYPGYIIKWSTGANEDLYEHEAHFILTDGYNYRVEFSVSADSADDEKADRAAFFKSVQLTDSAS